MKNLFFFGTLRHPPLLRAVLGRDVPMPTAALPEHAVFWAEGHGFPLLRRQAGAKAQGVYVSGLSAEDVARLDFYEGAFSFVLKEMQVELEVGSARAEVYFPPEGLFAVGRPWRLEDWQAQFGALNTAAAREIMQWFGRKSAEEMAARDLPIRIRAAGRVAAEARPKDERRDLTQDVVVEEARSPYIGFFAMQELRLRHRLYDGTMSAPMERSGLMSGQAAVVLPYDPVRDRVLLVEQFRAPVFMGGDPAPWVLEPVAGLVDPGETPEQTARREAMEEAGVALRGLEPVGRAYSSTGITNEFLHLFIGLCDLPNVPSGGGGLDGEGEDIRAELLPFEALMAQVDAQEIRDMPLLTCALWLARHRARLRADTASA